MKKIEFPYCNNVFLDNGIIGLYKYLLKDESLEKGTHFDLEEKRLWVEHDALFELLERTYYTMGREVYDTYTQKQEDEKGNLYFRVNNKMEMIGEPVSFPKMNTYGFTELLTNNAQGVTTKETNTLKFAEIEKKYPALSVQIKDEFEQRKVKLLSKIYLNERYTKLTRLETPTKAHFDEGSQTCYLTGNKRKKLVDAQNISPFFSGLTNFNSLLSTNDKKICWEALYLSRFSAVTSLYQYPNKLRDALNVYFVFSNNLLNLDFLISQRFMSLIKDQDSLKINEYLANFPRSEEDKKDIYLGKSNDFVGVNETLFFLIHCLYKEVLRTKPQINQSEFRRTIRNKPVGLVSIRAEAFASTMRPKQFEYVTHFSFVTELLYHLEKGGVNWRDIVQSLKILKPSLGQNKNRYELERQFRELVLGKVIKAKSILVDMEGFFDDCYGYLLDSLNDPLKAIGYKRYNDLLDFVTLYERIINHKIMTDKELQEKAIKLGAQIGQGILSYGETPERKTNARQGRKYIISLRKANQYDRFLQELARIQSRFTLNYSRDFLDSIDEERFQWVRQFVIISALNQINVELSPRKQDSNQSTK
ncbi:hypothetical protein DR864_29215 (plasmid) [Runella rosea]|uniref:CRISPR-associated protein Csh1 n=1 Tax=Runella rosea TaxID=2259595 RepID=A0A344TTK1_9BACT|nr:hypothetical protein [Runella rosea]AXE21972.1 hypothetical protein DR864_29215 [Runella rosea]